LLSSAILAPALLQALDDDAAKARLLPDLASGAKIATVAITGPSAGWIEGHVAVDATAVGTDWSLTGKAAFVTHAHIADVLLVVANAPDGKAEDQCAEQNRNHDSSEPRLSCLAKTLHHGMCRPLFCRLRFDRSGGLAVLDD
jgi:hypothetical protein